MVLRISGIQLVRVDYTCYTHDPTQLANIPTKLNEIIHPRNVFFKYANLHEMDSIDTDSSVRAVRHVELLALSNSHSRRRLATSVCGE